MQNNVVFFQGMLQSQIRHLCTDHMASIQTNTLSSTGNDKQNIITIYQLALMIHHDKAVTIAIQSNTQISFMLENAGLQ